MPTDTAHDFLVVGLRNAHAMESQAQELMERQIERTGDYPEVRARLRQHLDETKAQMNRLEECLDKCGETHSSLKDTAMSSMANMTAMGHAMSGDEILKNTFANNAFENFEIAAYKSLIVMADEAGVAVKQLLTQSLREEEAMAAWVEAHVEQITRDYMAMELKEAA